MERTLTPRAVNVTSTAIMLAAHRDDWPGIATLVADLSWQDLVAVTSFLARFATGLGDELSRQTHKDVLWAMETYALSLASTVDPTEPYPPH